MTATIVLVTGGNRGLGLGTAKRYLALSNHVVVAAVRDPFHATSQALSQLPRGAGSRVIVSRYDAAVWDDAAALVAELVSRHGVDHLDTVVANAALMTSFPLVKDARREHLLAHYEVNTLAIVALFQATRDLLLKSKRDRLPQFVIMGSAAGALGRQPPVPNALYGPTKAAAAWYGVRLHVEEDWLNTFVIDPGFVQTDGGNSSARQLGMKEAIITTDESVDGFFKVITTATKQNQGGRVILYTGELQIY